MGAALAFCGAGTRKSTTFRFHGSQLGVTGQAVGAYQYMLVLYHVPYMGATLRSRRIAIQDFAMMGAEGEIIIFMCLAVGS